MNIVREHHRRNIGKLFHRTRAFIGEMNRIADATCTIGLNRAHGGVEVWRPATDVFARGDDMVVRCDLTGVRFEDVNITFTGESLTITGTERSAADQDVGHRTASRSRGDFRCDITLAPGVTHDDVHATFDEGMLEVTLTDAARPPKETLIPIDVAERVLSPRGPVSEESGPGVPQRA